MNKEARMIQLVSTDGFIAAFWAYAKDTHTHKEAYEKLEQEYLEIFGKFRYSSYDSFRICRDYYNKTKAV